MHDDTPPLAPLPQPLWVQAAAFADLVHALTVRDLRAEHANPALGVLISIAQPVGAGLLFVLFLSVIGGRAAPLRADAASFVLSGFVLFFLHLRTAAAVAGALRRDLLNHARASPFLLVCVKALGALYRHGMAVVLLVALDRALRGPVPVEDAPRLALAVLLAWGGGVAVGMVLLALNRFLSWGPLVQAGYLRLCFFTSGKFFVGNAVPPGLRPVMEWNPLFHLLDQARDALFVHYAARTTDMGYAAAAYAGVLALGFLAEYRVRRTWSVSRAAG